MILNVEIEKYCKELEEKLPGMDETRFKYWQDKVHLLNRIGIEFMSYEDLMRTLALQHNEMKASSMRMAVELRELKQEVKHLKENIK